MASVGFAALAGICFWLAFMPESQFGRGGLLILGALMIQARLLCNLMDGLIAIEGGMKSPVGDVYNDLPDRVADVLIILGVGYGLTLYPHAFVVGWAAALLSVCTAYVRLLGGSCGLVQSFRGPMAKQHRMALLTGAAVVSVFLSSAWAQLILCVGLWAIVAGAFLTCLLRARGVMNELMQLADKDE